MTERVDFYILKSASAEQRLGVACRLIEKAYQRELRVAVASELEAEARALDELLWTFSDRSFVPHDYLSGEAAADPRTAVILCVLPVNPPAADVLVNLSTQLPPDWERHGRIAEIIAADEHCRQLGRERFKCYRDCKVSLETHQLEGSAEV